MREKGALFVRLEGVEVHLGPEPARVAVTPLPQDEPKIPEGTRSKLPGIYQHPKLMAHLR